MGIDKLPSLSRYEIYHSCKSFKVQVATDCSSSGLYYKSSTIVIYDCDDCIIVIHDRNDCGQYYKTTITAKASLS